ncbi:hypothetical protein CR162_17890 [Pseudoroseomonas rhizosphaerae]|uniref:Uncharacterized protein n=1 Tax=Teichococcus rhizosphaerae TaxID=1335062 RepID=A0A2C7AAA6_9PROT|nr:hypothetical protein [Pseudoroseomonas rhizosphaerae]PHK93557.1 hypothetical protein CR162_17890 [Pseudoroseomonas rhizosphaerae]
MDLNILVRGQSNAQVLASAGGYAGAKALVAEVQRLLGFDGQQDRVNLVYGQEKSGPATVQGGTGLIRDWLEAVPGGWKVGREEQDLLDFVGALPASRRDDPTAVVWLHSEYDSLRSDLSEALWISAVRFEASQLRAAFGQSAATVPYHFVSPHPTPIAGDLGPQVIRRAMETLAADPSFNAHLGARALDVDADFDNPDGNGLTREYGGRHLSATDAVTIAHRLALSIAEDWAAYARPGSPVAVAGGDIASLGPVVVAVHRIGPASLAVDVRHDRAGGFLPLGAEAAAGRGWLAQMADGSSAPAIHARALDADTLRLDFSDVLSDAGGTLHYGWGYGRLAAAGAPGRNNAIYDDQGLPLWTSAWGTGFGGASPVPLLPDTRALEYIASHADLMDAFGADALRGKVHQAGWGGAQNRAITFDGLNYLGSQPDLFAVLGPDAGAAARHWITDGRFEGRTIWFDALAYTASHDDLAQGFGLDRVAAVRHWAEHGRFEGRVIAFQGLDYIATHADLIDSFGADAAAGARHWIAHGRSEGRARDGFDAARYLENYADLRMAFGDDLQAAAEHFIVHGRHEGRSDASPWG